ncbi:MAG: GtrA family protein [Promethearchaeota archaeon]|nr:MAG: GtrA family protein [Candidatus Lokiarchaeota archaeon]
MEENSKLVKNDDFKKQLILYFFFAMCMILLNYAIQKSNQLFLAPFICHECGDLPFIQRFYCDTDPYNMPEFIGSIIAVGITYVVKFTLDKFIVFGKKTLQLKETSQEFFKYFGFAILTTIENIGIQFILTNFAQTSLEISMIIALSIGYFTKFLLDRKYVFLPPEKT